MLCLIYIKSLIYIKKLNDGLLSSFLICTIAGNNTSRCLLKLSLKTGTLPGSGDISYKRQSAPARSQMIAKKRPTLTGSSKELHASHSLLGLSSRSQARGANERPRSRGTDSSAFVLGLLENLDEI